MFIGCSGAVGARLSTDASTVRSLVGDALALIVQNVATVIAGLVIAFTANWLLAIIILLVLPLVGLQGFLQMRFYKGFSADAKVIFCTITIYYDHSNATCVYKTDIQVKMQFTKFRRCMKKLVRWQMML